MLRMCDYMLINFLSSIDLVRKALPLQAVVDCSRLLRDL